MISQQKQHEHAYESKCQCLIWNYEKPTTSEVVGELCLRLDIPDKLAHCCKHCMVYL